MNPITDLAAIRMAGQARALCEALAGIDPLLRFFADNYGPTGAGLDLELSNNPTGIIQDLAGNDMRAQMTGAQLQTVSKTVAGFIANVDANSGALRTLFAEFAANPRFFPLDR